MKTTIGKAVALITALCATALMGCSPTGWATKDLPDGSNITPGNTVTITQKDGATVTGRYIGEKEVPSSDYFNQYNESIGNNPITGQLPEIGERIELTTSLSDTRSWIGQLVGFDKKSIWVQLPHEQGPTEFYISSLTSLSHENDASIGGMQLRQFYMDGALPLSSALVVSGDQGDVYVPLNTVESVVEHPESRPTTVASIQSTQTTPSGSK
jgi:hypothetical protein